MAPEDARAFENTLGELPWAFVGSVVATPRLSVLRGGHHLIDLDIADLKTSFKSGLSYG